MLVLSGSGVVNVLNYIFNLAMSRMLTPADFGAVASLFSLFTILTVPATTITTYVSRFAAHAQSNGNPAHIAALYQWLLSKIWLVGAIFCAVMVALSPFIAAALKAGLLPVIIFAACLPISLIGSLNTGLLQGLQVFGRNSLLLVGSTLAKIIFAVGLVWAGYAVAGVMAGLWLSIVITVAAGWWLARRLLLSPDTTVKSWWPELVATGVPVLIASLCLAAMTNGDILIAKYFLSEHEAGLYSGLSVMGRTINYGALALLTVMLPLIAGTNNNSLAYRGRLLRISLLGVTILSFPFLLLFWLLPELAVSLLVGAQYLAIAPVLGWYSLAMLGITVATVFVQYFVAIHHKQFLWIAAAGVLLLLAALSIWHNSIDALTYTYTIAAWLLVAALAICYLKYPHGSKPISLEEVKG